MYKIKLYNNIAQKGLDRFNDRFLVGDDLQEEDAIIVRSANLHDLDYADNLKAPARAIAFKRSEERRVGKECRL